MALGPELVVLPTDWLRIDRRVFDLLSAAGDGMPVGWQRKESGSVDWIFLFVPYTRERLREAQCWGAHPALHVKSFTYMLISEITEQ